MTLGTLARFAVLASALALAGCMAAAKNTLSQNDITGMKLTEVAVSFAPDSTIQWEDGIRPYLGEHAIMDEKAGEAARSPGGKAYMQGVLTPQIKAGVEKAVAKHLNGSRPVRLNIVVRSFTIASAMQRIVVGGGHGMVADATLVDAKTGATILPCPKLVATLVVGQGVLGTAVQAAIDGASKESTSEKVADRYGITYRDWLLPNAQT
jgi:hypothetical protein